MKCLALRVAGRKSGDGSGGAGCSLERSLGGRGGWHQPLRYKLQGEQDAGKRKYRSQVALLAGVSGWYQGDPFLSILPIGGGHLPKFAR